MESDDDTNALGSDTHGVVHIVFATGSLRISVCTAWCLANKKLTWDAAQCHDHPTCVFCIAYDECNRRRRSVLRGFSAVAP